jgi:hypothetical protein
MVYWKQRQEVVYIGGRGGQDFGSLESNVLMPSSWHTGVINASASGSSQICELMLGLPPGLKRTERCQCTNREGTVFDPVGLWIFRAQLYRRANSIQIRIDHACSKICRPQSTM